MNELFIAAVDSLLELYGTSGTLQFTDGTTRNVKVSPFFPSKLIDPPEQGGRVVTFEASVLIQATDHGTLQVEPFRTKLVYGNVTYVICAATETPGNAVELGIKQ